MALASERRCSGIVLYLQEDRDSFLFAEETSVHVLWVTGAGVSLSSGQYRAPINMGGDVWLATSAGSGVVVYFKLVTIVGGAGGDVNNVAGWLP